jgi:hypothetical protein
LIYLYEFTFWTKPRDGTLVETWAQTSYEQPVTTTIGGTSITFTPQAAISHADIKYDNENAAGQITATVPRDHAIALKYLGGYPYGTIKLRVFELDEVGGTALSVWKGRIRSCTFSELTAELTGTDGREMLARLGLRLNAGRNCQWDLYGTHCALSKAFFTRTGTVLAISTDGLTVTTTLAEADDFFKAGLLECAGQARMVTKSVGGALTLMTALSGLAGGDSISATRGCDRTNSATSGCKSFDNYARYSGFADFDTPKNIFAEGVL